MQKERAKQGFLLMLKETKRERENPCESHLNYSKGRGS